MRIKNVTILLTLAWIIVVTVGCAEIEQASEDNQADLAKEVSNGENERGPEAMLELQGEPGTKFSGSCTVGDEEPEEISGELPESFTYELNRRPLKCEISSEADVQVDLSVGKNVRSVQRISGGTLNLTYENGSISSFVSSSSGPSGKGSSSSSSQVVSSSSPGTTSQKESNGVTNDSSNLMSESRNVSGFDEVELKGVGNLSIQQADNESLTVEAEEDILPKLRAEVENSRLIIGAEPNTSINTTQPINYKLTVKDLQALKVSGSGHIDADSISTDELSVTISGAGDIKISGKADSQEIDISGAGDYQAQDLESKEVNIDVRGSGSAIVNASEELDVEASGSGSVEYVGDPTIKQDVSGAGRVSKY